MSKCSLRLSWTFSWLNLIIRKKVNIFCCSRGPSWSWSYGSLDLQLPTQSVYITTEVVSSNLAHGEVYSILHYVNKVCQWLAAGLWFSPCTPDPFTNKTDHHDIVEILLKVAVNILTLILTLQLFHKYLPGTGTVRWDVTGVSRRFFCLDVGQSGWSDVRTSCEWQADRTLSILPADCLRSRFFVFTLLFEILYTLGVPVTKNNATHVIW
jgi:hypothetical protein